MPLEPTARHGAHPAMVLGVHIEPLIRGRRVAILGDATIDLAELLVHRGARLVHAYDPDPARAAEALARSAADRASPGPHAHFAAFEGDLGVRDGAFDVVVVPDLSLFDDPADVLRRARRLVPVTGAVVVASPNLEVKSRLLRGAGAHASASASATVSASPAASKPAVALGYYELFDVVSLQFPVVRMIGQAPFVGYTIADFALAGEPSVNVDTSLLETTEQPEWFIAIGSERPVTLDEFAVIELPLADVTLSSGAPGEAEAAAEDKLALIDARATLALLTTELEAARERHRAEAREMEAREKASAAMSAKLVELSAELEAREVRLKESQSRAGDAHVRAERLAHQIGDLEEEIRRQRDRATKLAKQLDDEKKARTKSDMELGMIRNKPEIAGAKDRLQELAVELDAARARIAELEMEHMSTQRVRDEAASAPPTEQAVAEDAALRSRLSELEIALEEARSGMTEATSKRGEAERRLEQIERGLEAERRTSAELKARSKEMEQARASLEEQRADLSRKVADLSRKSADLEPRIGELAQQNAELSRRNGELDRRVADLLRQQDEAVASVVPDLASAEELLRDRGRLIASLQRDLRESERIGKELVGELEALREATETSAVSEEPALPPAPVAASRDNLNDLRARLDTLAARSAKSEADLQAASWRVAQLERELADAQTTAANPSAALAPLEQALSAARAEIAALREAKPEAPLAMSAATDVARVAVEQSVLLHQVAGGLGQDR